MIFFFCFLYIFLFSITFCNIFHFFLYFYKIEKQRNGHIWFLGVDQLKNKNLATLVHKQNDFILLLNSHQYAYSCPSCLLMTLSVLPLLPF